MEYRGITRGDARNYLHEYGYPYDFIDRDPVSAASVLRSRANAVVTNETERTSLNIANDALPRPGFVKLEPWPSAPKKRTVRKNARLNAFGPARNDEGLTFEEWAHAAGYGDVIGRYAGDGSEEFEVAWRSGEDPTEYRNMSRYQMTPHHGMNSLTALPLGFNDLVEVDAGADKPSKAPAIAIGVVGLGLIGVAAYFAFSKPSASAPASVLIQPAPAPVAKAPAPVAAAPKPAPAAPPPASAPSFTPPAVPGVPSVPPMIAGMVPGGVSSLGSMGASMMGASVDPNQLKMG